jgi:multiple sugar transport system permease protein
MMNLKRREIHMKDRQYAMVFLLPAIICLAVLSIFPLLFTFTTSFFGWDLIKPGSQSNFVGFYNYVNVLTSESFWFSTFITLEYTFISVALAMCAGTALAFLFYQDLVGTWVVRTVVMAAMVISPVIIGTLWRLIYNPDIGLLTFLLESIGIRGTSFLANNKTVLGALIVVDVWEWAPLVMVIVLASLQGMPSDVFEAGVIDGCSAWKLFIYIKLPLLKPALLLSLLIRTMDCFRTFDSIYAMTGGGPGTASQNLNILMYNTGFEFFQISKVSAMAILSLIIILSICTFMVKKLQKGDANLW